jgi:hypothetical protein
MYFTCTGIGPFIWNDKKTGYVLQQITSTSGTCDIAALPSLPDIIDDIPSHHALQLITNPRCLYTAGRTAFLL